LRFDELLWKRAAVAATKHENGIFITSGTLTLEWLGFVFNAFNTHTEQEPYARYAQFIHICYLDRDVYNLLHLTLECIKCTAYNIDVHRLSQCCSEYF